MKRESDVFNHSSSGYNAVLCHEKPSFLAPGHGCHLTCTTDSNTVVGQVHLLMAIEPPQQTGSKQFLVRVRKTGRRYASVVSTNTIGKHPVVSTQTQLDMSRLPFKNISFMSPQPRLKIVHLKFETQTQTVVTGLAPFSPVTPPPDINT